MRLDPRQAVSEIPLRVARFGEHGESGVEFLAADEIEITRDRTGALSRLRLDLVTRFDQIVQDAPAEGEHIFDECFVGHGS